MVFHSNNPISVYEVSKLKQHLTGILPNVEHATMQNEHWRQAMLEEI